MPPREIALKKRREQAVKLRCKGLSYLEIAQVIKAEFSDYPSYSETNAHNDIKISLKESAELLSEEIDEIRQLECSRLDQWLLKLQAGINKGDPKSINTALAIQERRAKLLGLDAPIEIKVQTQVRGQISEFLLGLKQNVSFQAWQEIRAYIQGYQAQTGNELATEENNYQVTAIPTRAISGGD